LIAASAENMANENGNNSDNLVYFLIGAGIGAMTAILFAPKPGRELRSEIADVTKKGIDYARDSGRELSEHTTEYYQTGVERAAEMRSRSKAAVNDITERGKELLNREKAQFAAAIEAGKQGYNEAKQADQNKIDVEES
jgi:gas vesicle protein